VSKGEGPLLNVREAGDEPVLMSEKLPGVSVVKRQQVMKPGC